jgi:hypothetical protein
MAARHSYYHNPSLGSEVGGWQALAENVGKGSDAASLHSAFMASSGHRHNILSPTYTEVGVGTATDSAGTLYVVEIFRLPAGASSYAPVRRTSTATPRIRTRVPARSSRSGRRVAAPPRRVGPSPAMLLRRRLATASGWSSRSNRTTAIKRMVLFHDVVVYLVPR